LTSLVYRSPIFAFQIGTLGTLIITWVITDLLMGRLLDTFRVNKLKN
jgi:hypothetical protein